MTTEHTASNATDSPTGALSEREGATAHIINPPAFAKMPAGVTASMTREQLWDYAMLCGYRTQLSERDRAALASRSTEPGGEAPDKWIFDPHDIEQGMMLNPAWLKLHNTTAQEVHRQQQTPAAASTPPPISASKEAAPEGERTPKDYAIEFAGYMCVRAETLLDALHDEATGVPEDERISVADCCTSLRAGIYEFRKRRDAVTSPAPAQAPSRTCEHGCNGCDECTDYDDIPKEPSSAVKASEEEWSAEDVEAVICCLDDDAALMLDDNSEDERAHNMQRAAAMIQVFSDRLAAATSEPLAPVLTKVRQLLERMDRRGGLGLDVHEWIRDGLDELDRIERSTTQPPATKGMES